VERCSDKRTVSAKTWRWRLLVGKQRQGQEWRLHSRSYPFGDCLENCRIQSPPHQLGISAPIVERDPPGSPHRSISAHGHHMKQMHTDDNLSNTPTTPGGPPPPSHWWDLDDGRSTTSPPWAAEGCLPKGWNMWLTALEAGRRHGPAFNNTCDPTIRRRAPAPSYSRPDRFTGKLENYPSPHLSPRDATAESV